MFPISVPRNWITIVNILLVLTIFVASLSIPGEIMEEDARFIGDVGEDDRKFNFC